MPVCPRLHIHRKHAHEIHPNGSLLYICNASHFISNQKRCGCTKETLMPPAHAANLVSNSGNALYWIYVITRAVLCPGQWIRLIEHICKTGTLHKFCKWLVLKVVGYLAKSRKISGPVWITSSHQTIVFCIIDIRNISDFHQCACWCPTTLGICGTLAGLVVTYGHILGMYRRNVDGLNMVVTKSVFGYKSRAKNIMMTNWSHCSEPQRHLFSTWITAFNYTVIYTVLYIYICVCIAREVGLYIYIITLLQASKLHIQHSIQWQGYHRCCSIYKVYT